MNIEEHNYLKLLNELLHQNDVREDRTGVGTRSIFGSQLRFSLEDGKIPILTTKKMFAKGAIEELLFFIRGDTDTKLLEAKGVNIWKGNTSREFLDKKRLLNYPEGQMGPMYGFQWRKFGCRFDNHGKDIGNKRGIDQLQNAFNLIKTDPNSRRIIVSAYNPEVSGECVLDPCHMFFQFYVKKDTLSCQFYMRSVDTFLGLPFNLMSYAVLTHMMAKATGLKAKELVFVGGDTHLYESHYKQAITQIMREPYDFPILNIKKELSSIKDMEKLSFEDFEIKNYNCHPAIKAEMAI